MYTCVVDGELTRTETKGLSFPLGVYPVEPIEASAGYVIEFEAADGAEDGSDVEEWPDRYVLDIVVSAERLPVLVVQLLALMPSRVFPILDFMGHDEYREIDPFISYDRIGVDLLVDALRQFRGFFFEDGMVGFGAMSESPFFYLFVDEHKIVTLRVEPVLKERVEKLLEAFELEEKAEPVGVDAVAHEHRSVLVIDPDRPNVLSAEEIVGYLRQEWRLILNVDPEQNLDEEGRELGLTGWRGVLRCAGPDWERAKYVEVLAWARNLNEAEELAHTAAGELLEDPSAQEWAEIVVMALDRVGDDRLREMAGEVGAEMKEKETGLIHSRWVE